mmetsp:Transcript_126437/g.300232  ORF Transcript_126437/g.300232 Transcript_126437/m.300232 type:complete len:217 (-) Transcript_126437:16-666(-)
MNATTCALVSSRVSPVSTMRSARIRFSTSGTCLAKIAVNLSGSISFRARTRARCCSAGALTTTTKSQCCSRCFSKSSGISRMHSGSDCRDASAMKASRAASTSGWTIASSSWSFCLFSSPTTSLDRDFRSMLPSSAKTPSPKASRMGLTASPPGAYSRWTVASASSTGMFISRSHFDTVLLPMPMLPVRPTTKVSPTRLPPRRLAFPLGCMVAQGL